MTNRLTVATIWALSVFMPVVAGAQTLVETYRAEIAPVDRRNSSGAALTDPAAILAQDRANVHRFGQRQAGDTVDSSFTEPERRAAMASFVARGSFSQAALQALLLDGGVILDVEVWGTGGNVDYVTVDVVSEAAPGLNASDPELTAIEIERDAARIQAALNASGFDAGPVDGQPGRRTRDAISAFQRTIGRPATGVLTRSDWDRLQSAAAGMGPSFDCAKAGTPTERAICTSPVLSSLDRALTDAWSSRRQRDGSGELLAEQRRWIAKRDACGSNAACLERSMRDRVEVLGGDVPVQGSMLADADPGIASDPDTAASQEPSVVGATEGGLITIDGRILYSTVDAGALALPGGGEAIQKHEQALARRLAFTSWAVGSDDLATSLAEVPNFGLLRGYFDMLPRPAQDEIVRLGLSGSGVTGTNGDYCFNNARISRLSCATQGLETVFDQRRFVQAAAKIIADAVKAERLDLPVPVRAFCPLGPIDQAYDFDTGTVDWASMIGHGCRLTGTETNLAAAVPERTQMDAAQVEDLARRYLATDAQGQRRLFPLVLAFDGELRVERKPGAQAGPDGMASTVQTLHRIGPVDLRWSGEPEKVILSFEAPTGNQPPDAVDLRLAGPAFRLLQAAPELDATRLRAALSDAGLPTDGTLVRLPAWPFDSEGPARLSIGDFFLPEEPAQQIAALVGQPLEHVAWTQLISQETGVPDTELVLVFPSPYASLESEPIDPSLAQGRNQEDVALLARISEPMQMGGAAGPALVAAVRPLSFEITELGIGDARKVVAHPALAAVEAVPQKRVFLPSVWWFAAKGAELRGVELGAHLNAAMDRANLHSGDTFARLDAVAAAEAAIERTQADASGAPWVAGRITLGAYDLERQAWPVNDLNLVLPASDRTEEAVARRVQPQIDVRALSIPMSIDEARAFEEAREAARRRSGPLDFYARVDLLAPDASDQLAVRAHIRELFLFPLEGSQSQPMKVSPAFDREGAIARLEYGPLESPVSAAAEGILGPVSPPAATPPTDPEPSATVSTAAPGASPVPPEVWPELPDLTVSQSRWDVLGLRTGMTLAEAEAKLMDRGGMLAAFEKPRAEPDPSNVQATLYQRMYVMADGTEAITLAAPSPQGPVLVILRRLQLPRGDLPFDSIRQSLREKYGSPSIENAAPSGSRMYWFDGAPGPAQSLCRAHFPRRTDLQEWGRLDRIGGSLDLSQRPASWDWAIADIPVDYAEQAARCGRVLTFEPEGAEQLGGAAFSMMFLDIEALRTVDEKLAGVSGPQERKIDF